MKTEEKAGVVWDKLPQRFKRHMRPPTLDDVNYMEKHASEMSRREATYMFHKSVQEACFHGLTQYRKHLCVTLVNREGRVFGMGGVSPESIWLLLCEGATEDPDIRRLLTREAQPFLRWVMNESGLVTAEALENQTFDGEGIDVQLRWLRWLGADVMRVPMYHRDYHVFWFPRSRFTANRRGSETIV